MKEKTNGKPALPPPPENVTFESITARAETIGPYLDQKVTALVEHSKAKCTEVLAVMCVAEGLRRKARKSAIAMGATEAQLVEFERAAGITAQPVDKPRVQLVDAMGRPLQ